MATECAARLEGPVGAAVQREGRGAPVPGHWDPFPVDLTMSMKYVFIMAAPRPVLCTSVHVNVPYILLRRARISADQ